MPASCAGGNRRLVAAAARAPWWEGISRRWPQIPVDKAKLQKANTPGACRAEALPGFTPPIIRRGRSFASPLCIRRSHHCSITEFHIGGTTSALPSRRCRRHRPSAPAVYVEHRSKRGALRPNSGTRNYSAQQDARALCCSIRGTLVRRARDGTSVRSTGPGHACQAVVTAAEKTDRSAQSSCRAELRILGRSLRPAI